MKKIWLLIFVMCLSVPGLSEQLWAPEGVELGGSSTPIPMPKGLILSDVHPEFVPSLPTGYFLNDAEYEGQALILLYRENADGVPEILMSVRQEDTSPHSLNYVEGSYEQSGEQFLYFMLINGQTLHGSLYLFSLADKRMNLVLEEPCSTYMAVFPDPSAEISGLGWVAYRDYILPIDLGNGSSYEGGAMSISSLGGMPAIDGDFFAGDIAENERKYTYLKPSGNGILQITTVVKDTVDAAHKKIVTQYYDCVNKRLTQP